MSQTPWVVLIRWVSFPTTSWTRRRKATPDFRLQGLPVDPFDPNTVAHPVDSLGLSLGRYLADGTASLLTLGDSSSLGVAAASDNIGASMNGKYFLVPTHSLCGTPRGYVLVVLCQNASAFPFQHQCVGFSLP